MSQSTVNKENNGKLKAQRVFCYAVLIVLTFLSLFFFYMLFINSTRSHAAIGKGFSFIPGKSTLVNLHNVLNNPNLHIVTGLINSIIVAGLSALFTVYFSSMTAYGIHVYDFKGKNQAFKLILLIMMIPTQVSALGFVQMMNKMGLRDNFIPLIVPAIAAPVTVFFMKQYMESNLSIELIEAARVDGAKEFYIFNRIILPIFKPAMAVQAIFTFVGSWNNYFTPNLLLDSPEKKTLPILIAQLRSADFLKFDMGQVYMLITLSILPVIVMYLILSKYIVGGVALGGVKE